VRKIAKLAVLEGAASMIAFGSALWVNYAAGRYVDRVGARQTPIGQDLLLNLLPHRDVSSLFIWGFAGFVVFAGAAAVVMERRRIPYMLWMYSMLILVRAFFVTLTPMGAPAGYSPLDGSAIGGAIGGYLSFKNDLFFSAHTAMPFLGFLVFRQRWVSWMLLGMSLCLAACVLIGRYHYSIDVAAAFFITYAFVKWHRRVLESRYLDWKRRWLLGRS